MEAIAYGRWRKRVARETTHVFSRGFLSTSREVVDEGELQKRRKDESYADDEPHVDRFKVGHWGQAEPDCSTLCVDGQERRYPCSDAVHMMFTKTSLTSYGSFG